MSGPRIRGYETSDLGMYVELRNAVDPMHTVTTEDVARRDTAWDAERYHRARYVAEDQSGAMVGWGQIAHTPWQFDPGKYEMRLETAPNHRRRGVGSAVFSRLLADLRARDAVLVRAMAIEGNDECIGFLTRRGFREAWRNLPSRLDVDAFDPRPFADAAAELERQGLTISTLAEELARNGKVLRDLYDLQVVTSAGQEEADPITPPPFEEYVADQIEAPSVMPEAWFLARDGQRLAGLSSLERSPGPPDVIQVGYTAVHPDYRGRRIALALKLRTIAFARDHGYRSIVTESNANNAPMLRINRALGFREEPAHITFELAIRG